MKRNDLLLITIALMLMISLAGAVNAQTTTQGSSLNVALVSQTPIPVQPGSNAKLSLNLQNSGYSDATNVVLEMVPRNPFSLISGQDAIKTYSRLNSQSYVNVNYDLKVDGDAVSDTYYIDFKIFPSGAAGNYFITKIPILVRGEPKIFIEDVKTNPEKLESGFISDVTIYLKNHGTGTAKQVYATITATDILIPVLSGGSLFLGNIAPGETKQVGFKINIDSSAEHKTYTLPVAITYADESNTENTDSLSVGIPVTGSVTLEIIKIEPNYDRAQLEIDVANKGTTEAKSIEAKLYSNGELVDIDYISQINPTKKSTFKFPLIYQGKGQLVLEYMGPGTERNNLTKDMIFNYNVNGNGGDGSSGYALIIVIVVVVVGYWYYRKKKKKKKHAAAKHARQHEHHS